MSFNEDIKAYIDGELSPERAEEVRRALEQDQALMEEYTSMKQISTKLQSLVRQPQIKGVEQTMRAVAPARRFRWREGIAVAAMLAIVGAIAYPTFMQAKSSANSEVATASGSGAPADAALKSETERNERDFGSGATLDQNGGGGGAAGKPRFDDKSVYQGYGVPEEAPAIAGVDAPGRGMAMQDGTIAKPMTEAHKTLTYSDADFEARLVIKDAAFTVRVGNVTDAMDKATQLARTNGGYIEASSIEEGTREMTTTGYLTLRIPQKNFEAAVEKIRSYGEIKSENTSGDDVTGQVTDVEARINTLKAEEESYRELLRRATRIGDVLDIKDRISQVRQQIESYDSQRRMLRGLSALATISLRFTTDKKLAKPVPKQNSDDVSWFDDTKLAALGILKGVGRFVAQVGTFAFILVPVWLPVLLFLLWFRRRAFAPNPLTLDPRP